MPGQIRKVDRSFKSRRCQRNHFLQPCRPQCVIAQTELVRTALFLESQLQRLDQSQQKGRIQKLEVSKHSLPADVGIHRMSQLREIETLRRRLAHVPACETKHFFEQMLVALLPAGPHPQIVLNCPPNHSFVEKVRQNLP